MVEITGQNSTRLPVDTMAKNQLEENLDAKLPEFSAIDNAAELTDDNTKITDIVENTNSINNELHKETSTDNTNDTVTTNVDKSKLQQLLDDAPPWVQFFRNHLVTGLNAIGIGLNTLSVVATHSSIMPEAVSDYLDKTAEWYSRYIVSIGFGWNGIESLAGRRPIEAITRFAPAVGFLTLPFYNFNLSTGISSTLSYLFDKVVRRNGDQQPGVGSAWENTKGVLKHSGDILKELFNKDSKESLVERFGLVGLGVGTFGGLLFAHNDRDSKVARFFGNLRNIGGIVGDYELVFNNDKTWRGNHKRLVGLTCSLASVLNIIARWVDPKLGRTLNHIAIAADDFGLTYWAQMSKKDNDEAQGIDLKKKETDIFSGITIRKGDAFKPQVQTKQTEASKENIENMHTALAA